MSNLLKPNFGIKMDHTHTERAHIHPFSQQERPNGADIPFAASGKLVGSRTTVRLTAEEASSLVRVSVICSLVPPLWMTITAGLVPLLHVPFTLVVSLMGMGLDKA